MARRYERAALDGNGPTYLAQDTLAGIEASAEQDIDCRFSSGLASDTSPDQDTGQFS